MKALAVGRLVPVKNFDVLIEAWQHVDIALRIAGTGPEESRLRDLSRTVQAHERVHFLGHRDDVPELMDDAEIVVVPSEQEGFGYVTLEALQARCVVVATKSGIAADLLPARFLISPSKAALAKCVNGVIADFERALRDFEPVWRHARRLTVSQMATETAKVYESLLIPGRNVR